MFYNTFFDEKEDEFYSDDDCFESSDSGSCSMADFQQTSDTLVLHPADRSTDFLSAIYRDKGWDVINNNSIKADTVEKLIRTHDRIVCLGHGFPGGLFGGSGLLINDRLAPLLRGKKLVCIWCNADQFMQRHELKGFYSGMFLSETGECDLFGVRYKDERQVQRSNELFASVLGRYIDSGRGILNNVKREYQDKNDPVITFNRDRLYADIVLSG